MNELDPMVLLAVFREMLGGPLLWLMVLTVVVGTLAFVALLVRERGVVASRMVRCQLAGLVGGALALVLMARVSSSGFTDAGGAADWFLIGLVFGLGAAGTTILAYAISGWASAWRRSGKGAPEPSGAG